jgi:hypothetical protein
MLFILTFQQNHFCGQFHNAAEPFKALNNINELAFEMQMHYVFFGVGTEVSDIIYMSFMLQTINRML